MYILAVCMHACVCVWPKINWPMLTLYTPKCTLDPYRCLCVSYVCVCVCCPFLGNKNIINGVQATASFVSITNSDKGKNMKALVKASHCKR